MKLVEQNRIDLLKYMFDGLKNMAELIDLNLLPLADGNWIAFKPSSSNEKIYLGSKDHPQRLLPELDSVFLKVAIVPKRCKEITSKSELCFILIR